MSLHNSSSGLGGTSFDERDAWHEHPPSTRADYEFIAAHGLAEYANWHLGIDDEASVDTRA